MQAATISSLLRRALATNQPHELVDRILRLTQESAAPAPSLDTTGLDVSVEVAELRKVKEVVVRQKKGSATLLPPRKENKGKGNETSQSLSRYYFSFIISAQICIFINSLCSYIVLLILLNYIFLCSCQCASVCNP